MKVEEAISRVEIAFGYSTAIHDDWKPDEEAEKIAIEAMNKQDPMKPVIEKGAPSYYGGTSICRYYYSCPKCSEAVGRGDDKANYCPYCGQKIDWED